MRYTHGGNPEKNTKRVYPCGVRVEGKGYSETGTPLDVHAWMPRRVPCAGDVRYEAMGRHSESDRIGGEMSDDGGTPSSSFRFMESVGAVVKLQS